MILSQLLDTMLERDKHGDTFNEYRIRSLYFDSPWGDALYEKLSGVPERNKYRIRLYNNNDKYIRLECKRKVGDMTAKDAAVIPRDLAEQLIARDTAGLLETNEPLLHQMWREITTRLSRPVVIVDYIREAYTFPTEDVRITFDKQLRSGLHNINLFDPNVPLIDPFASPTIILEVKYNKALALHVRDLLCSVTAQRQSFSKFTICRNVGIS
jgi:SPX domain protein involved in polyphosphate accumulation